MSENYAVSRAEVDSLYEKTKKDAAVGGYILNPDEAFTRTLIEGLAVNQKRYGYQSCPCRLAEGVREKDRDIICPCDYRDADVAEYGACYCGLYVSRDVADKKQKLQSIPERRKSKSEGLKPEKEIVKTSKIKGELKYPVWRCSVCGYLCARDSPPDICPICRVSKDRFEKFME